MENLFWAAALVLFIAAQFVRREAVSFALMFLALGVGFAAIESADEGYRAEGRAHG